MKGGVAFIQWIVVNVDIHQMDLPKRAAGLIRGSLREGGRGYTGFAETITLYRQLDHGVQSSAVWIPP